MPSYYEVYERDPTLESRPGLPELLRVRVTDKADALRLADLIKDKFPPDKFAHLLREYPRMTTTPYASIDLTRWMPAATERLIR